MKHIIVILIFVLSILGVTAYILHMTKKESYENDNQKHNAIDEFYKLKKLCILNEEKSRKRIMDNNIPHKIIEKVVYFQKYFPKNIEELFKNHQPIIIRKSIKYYFPNLKIWTTNYLNEKIGNELVVIRKSKNDIYHFIPENGTSKVYKKFKDVSKLKNVYAAENKIFPILQKEIEWNNKLDIILKKIRMTKINKIAMWKSFYSTKKIINPLHYDPYDNLFLMIDGSKKFTLFPPNDRKYLYPAKKSFYHEYSLVKDLNKKENKQYPCFRFAKKIDITLYQGDILILPFGWWHTVETKPNSCAVSFWFEHII